MLKRCGKLAAPLSEPPAGASSAGLPTAPAAGLAAATAESVPAPAGSAPTAPPEGQAAPERAPAGALPATGETTLDVATVDETSAGETAAVIPPPEPPADVDPIVTLQNLTGRIDEELIALDSLKLPGSCGSTFSSGRS